MAERFIGSPYVWGGKTQLGLDCSGLVQASLQARDWEEAERYCDRLAGYSAKEPFPWADFIIARGRALARVGRGETRCRTGKLNGLSQ